ncbi:MAG: helix-turn-helix transcriptional regulator [Phycisphaerales bacterium]|nr:helix-turn-helix transcriptional regulator [Phycisphaerales bacterium]
MERVSPQLTDEAFFRIAKALADPTRVSVLERIARDGDVLCAEIIEGFPISQATMSHHLKELREAGLIETEKEGKCVRLKALPGALSAFREDLARRVPGA